MAFEIGKYYKHTTGMCLSILCRTQTTMWGDTLIAEVAPSSTFMAVGSSEADTQNFHEITHEEWMSNFS